MLQLCGSGSNTYEYTYDEENGYMTKVERKKNGNIV